MGGAQVNAAFACVAGCPIHATSTHSLPLTAARRAIWTRLPKLNRKARNVALNVSMTRRKKAGSAAGTRQAANTRNGQGASPSESGGPNVSRAWVSLAPSNTVPAGLQASDITVASYNILAQCYVSPKQFPATPSHARRCRYRRASLVREVVDLVDKYDVDVLCLQELEVDFCGEIARASEKLSSYVYKRRGSEPSPRRDGSGIFWNPEKLEPVGDQNAYHIELNEIAEDEDLSRLCGEQRPLTRDCVSAFLCLRVIETGVTFVVSSTHIFWDPAFPLIKLAQAIYVRRYADALAKKAKTQSVILAGDWNCMPNSSAFAFLQDGEVPLSHEEVSNVDVTTCTFLQQTRFSPMQSAYDYSHDSSENGQLTTLTHKFSGALDHIFVRTDKSPADVITGRFSLPSRACFQEKSIQALPSVGHGSDHLPVVVRVSVRSANPEPLVGLAMNDEQERMMLLSQEQGDSTASLQQEESNELAPSCATT